VDQWISGSVVKGAPTEEPRPDASNARSEESTTGHKGNWRASCSCLCVEHPWPVVSHRRFTLPRSSILCGCINIPGRQVNAVWGRYPAVCAMYVEKKAGSLLGGALRQNLSRLRVEKLGCAGSRQVIPAVYQRLDLKRASPSVEYSWDVGWSSLVTAYH
jgi:hypothetical protein